jgi:hypothetical protein
MISLACSPPWLSFLLAFHDVLIVSLLNSGQRRLFFYRNLIEIYATVQLQEFSNYYQKKSFIFIRVSVEASSSSMYTCSLGEFEGGNEISRDLPMSYRSRTKTIGESNHPQRIDNTNLYRSWGISLNALLRSLFISVPAA